MERIQIYSPFKAQVMALSEVRDAAFSSKMMGEGVGLIPLEDEAISPVDAKITLLIDTAHAVGLESAGGAEILLHIGKDTVELKGKYFKAHVKEEDMVKKGEPLLGFDREGIKAAGYDITSVLTVVNSDKFSAIHITDKQEVERGDLLMEIER